MTSIPECTPDLLRTLFLFESLSDERLDYLCEHGEGRARRAGLALPRG